MRGTARLQLESRSPSDGQALKEAQLHERISLGASAFRGAARLGNTPGSPTGSRRTHLVRTRERMVRRDVGGASNQQGATVWVVKTLKGSVTPRELTKAETRRSRRGAVGSCPQAQPLKRTGIDE
jgi:hypothetical protein